MLNFTKNCATISVGKFTVNSLLRNDFMYCTSCGSILSENSKFCHICGTPVLRENAPVPNVPKPKKPAENPISFEENPYALPSAPAIPEADTAPYSTAAEPASPYLGENSPMYYRAVKTPQGISYVPVEASSAPKANTSKVNVFGYISASIMGTMLLFCIFPWLKVNGVSYSIFEIFFNSTYLEYYDADAFALCSVLIFVAIGMLIPGLVLTLKKRSRTPLGFAIAASVLTFVALLIFAALMTSCSSICVDATANPSVMLVLAVSNIVFAAIARTK